MTTPLADPADLPDWLARLSAGLADMDFSVLRHGRPAPDTARQASVLMLFGAGPAGPDLLLLRRADTLGAHPGQVAFPGGGADPADGGPVATALREAEEEVGLLVDGVRPVALLPKLFVPVSGFQVSPVLAWWERRLDDFDRRGWHNHVQVVGEPVVEYVGLANRGDDRNLFHRHLRSRGGCWPCDGYCRLPALPDNERRSIRPAQRMNPGIVSNLWLLPAVPFAAAVLILSLRKSRRKSAAVLAIGGQIVVLAISIVAFLPTLQTHDFRAVQNFTWFTFGEQTLRLGFVLDPLAAAMLVMISLVGLCIFVFSVGYMADDKNFTRFFAYLSFFSGAMLGVVIANSLLLLFMFWELVGLASYLLIGFWIERPSAAAAAKKAFITTRIGDMGFFLGMLWLYNRSSTLLFYDGGRGCLESAGLAMLGASATFIALLVFCGAVGKSGQFPLHVWLPDAMEGPTPVSALIHAATMVAAGVFLVARVYPLFSLGAVNGMTSSLTVVVWIGVTTALMAALIAIAQADIKRILAYSTVSQLGLMMVSLGVGGVAAGIMHLIAHGFFKALLFLGSGSVIH